MKRYGYLGRPSSSEALVTEDAVIRGLMKLQTFARLPATGRIDAATLKVFQHWHEQYLEPWSKLIEGFVVVKFPLKYIPNKADVPSIYLLIKHSHSSGS